MLARGDEARCMFPRLLASRPDEEVVALTDPVPDSPRHDEMDRAQPVPAILGAQAAQMVQGGWRGGDQQGCPP